MSEVTTMIGTTGLRELIALPYEEVKALVLKAEQEGRTFVEVPREDGKSVLLNLHGVMGVVPGDTRKPIHKEWTESVGIGHH